MARTIVGGTWTYADPSSSDLYAVRFNIGDTNQDDQRLSDEEILYLLTLTGSVAGASSRGARAILGQIANEAEKKQVGDLRIEYPLRRLEELRALANDLDDASGVASRPLVGGIAGGISVAAKQARASDADSTRPAFYRGMSDLGHAPGGDYGRVP